MIRKGNRVRRRGARRARQELRAAPRLALRALATCALLAACDEAVRPVDPPPEPPAPASIEVVSGDGQRAVQGLPVLDPVVVRVLDSQGQPIGGQGVAFSPAAGHGTADPASAVTDGDGRAATSWTLGPDPGNQTLAVAATGVTAAVTASSIDLEAELDAIFQPPTEPEIDVVRADWARRDYPAADVRVELAETLDFAGAAARLRIVSHTVGGARHYGGVIVPDVGAPPGTLPILAYLHGGESGVSVAEAQFTASGLGELRDRFVYVIPSFRSEPLRYGDSAWISEGNASHWDRDVDDMLALINVAIETTPEAKPDSINMFGGSRGAGVALLAGVRDERIARIVAFFGPTYFFDDWVRQIAREAALRTPRRLTGVAHLDSTIVQPYFRGELGPADARLALLRRSSAVFAADLPSVQLHHGTIDFTVDVSQAHALMERMEALGRGAPDFEAYIYDGGGHEILGLAEAIPRAAAFLARAFGPA